MLLSNISSSFLLEILCFRYSFRYGCYLMIQDLLLTFFICIWLSCNILEWRPDLGKERHLRLNRIDLAHQHLALTLIWWNLVWRPFCPLSGKLCRTCTSQPQERQPQPIQLNSEMEATSLQLITESANPGISSTFSLSAQEPGISKLVALGIDTKIKAKIWANEYI